jgi:hypothetical protein
MKQSISATFLSLVIILFALPIIRGPEIDGRESVYRDGHEDVTIMAATSKKARKKPSKDKGDTNWIKMKDDGKEVIDDVVIKDDTARKLVEDEQKKIRAKKAHFTLGLQSGMNVQEGYARILAIMPMGVGYKKFTFTANPMFLYLKSESSRAQSTIGKMTGTRGGGLIYETGISFEFNYHFFNLNKYKYTPFIYAGPGYNYRNYSFRLRSALGGLSRNNDVHSLTLHFGFGLSVMAGKYVRLRFGLGGISYFNDSKVEFDYDTTGISFNFGASVVFK